MFYCSPTVSYCSRVSPISRFPWHLPLFSLPTTITHAYKVYVPWSSIAWPSLWVLQGWRCRFRWSRPAYQTSTKMLTQHKTARSALWSAGTPDLQHGGITWDHKHCNQAVIILNQILDVCEIREYIHLWHSLFVLEGCMRSLGSENKLIYRAWFALGNSLTYGTWFRVREYTHLWHMISG